MAERLDDYNILRYVRQTYGEVVNQEKHCIQDIQSYLQNDYEGDMDCTLVSLMTCCKFFNKQINERICYDFIKQVAKKYFYTDNIGTQAPFINAIAKQVFNRFGIRLRPRSAYFKNVGWNKRHIIRNIDENKPVILSLWKDGRDYYRDHSVTCIGYAIYRTSNCKEHFFLILYDNWYKTIGYLDYDKLSLICSINYFIN